MTRMVMTAVVAATWTRVVVTMAAAAAATLTRVVAAVSLRRRAPVRTGGV